MHCVYKTNKSLIYKFTYYIGKVLNCFIGNYGSFLIVGDLNSEIIESSMHEFFKDYNLQIMS